MSILDDVFVTCTRLVETGGTEGDGMGGVRPRWMPGDTFTAALAFVDIEGARQAERFVEGERCQVLTDKGTLLRFHDVFQRPDGEVFRVTKSNLEKVTPDSAGLSLRLAEAERWVLPG